MAERRGPVGDPALGVHHPDQHLRPAQIDPIASTELNSRGRSGWAESRREGSGPCGSITRYASHGDRATEASRATRAARLQGLPVAPRPAEPAAGTRPRHAARAGGARARPARRRAPPREPGSRPRAGPPWRRILKWVGIAALAWLLLSFLAFAVSAQIQRRKLADMGDTLSGNPFLAVSPQTILVLGTDVRPRASRRPARTRRRTASRPRAEARRRPLAARPYRADTIMLSARAGARFASSRSPATPSPRSRATDDQKINAAYAFGGAKLEVRTVEKFLGIDVDQVALVDFNGFRDFIDSIGGVPWSTTRRSARRSRAERTTAASASSSTRASTRSTGPGPHLARTRENLAADPDGNPCPPIADLDRAPFQQDILSGIKDRLTDPLRLPYNFLKGRSSAGTRRRHSSAAWAADHAAVRPVRRAGGGSGHRRPEAVRGTARSEASSCPGRVRSGGEEVPGPRPAARRRPAPRQAEPAALIVLRWTSSPAADFSELQSACFSDFESGLLRLLRRSPSTGSDALALAFRA